MQIFDAWGPSIFVEKRSSISHFCSTVSALGVQVNRNTHIYENISEMVEDGWALD